MPVKRPQRSLHDLIRTRIEAHIISGEWEPGFKIPYEHELMDQFGCSRMTVNKALATLVEKGLIARRKKAGSFVAEPQAHRASIVFPDVGACVKASGERYAFTVLSSEEREATAFDTAELAIDGGPVLSLTCLHHANEGPFALEQRLINLALVPEARAIDFDAISPSAWLLAHVPWADARHRISALGADKSTARWLDVGLGHACISVERWTWRVDERLTYVRLTYPSERYSLEAHFCP